ncbi:hypothetical protein [Pedobacter sp.]|jgi:hypothetical protein|uniref:hypothetical protein n=1 Tax=Pedobacter sp. TaxID=1411316 RepID=UPI002D00932B|nr:hypothetical protein [Pedobacter sp.]HWW42235.1 hypothetical protein [Pedobacter sp.]
MKKAKLMLAAIAVLAVAGGVFAANANRNLGAVVYTHSSTDPIATRCTVTLVGYTTTTNLAPKTLFATTTTSLPCVTKTFYITD